MEKIKKQYNIIISSLKFILFKIFINTKLHKNNKKTCILDIFIKKSIGIKNSK